MLQAKLKKKTPNRIAVLLENEKLISIIQHNSQKNSVYRIKGKCNLENDPNITVKYCK